MIKADESKLTNSAEATILCKSAAGFACHAAHQGNIAEARPSSICA